jgi:hypothetical protein
VTLLQVILLTWEFPPREVGQVGRDMEKAAVELAKSGCKLDVVTYHDSLLGIEEHPEGFRVHRVTNPVQTHVNIVTWALTLNTELQRVAANIILESQDEFRLIHATEWLCVPAAIQLKKTLTVPFILSLYSIEPERSSGGPLSDSIKYFERTGCLEAAKVVVTSANRAERVQKLYKVTREKLAILDLRGRWVERLMEQYKAVLSVREKSHQPALG